MLNSPVKVLDNIGAVFTQDNKQIIIKYSLPGYDTLTNKDVNTIVPYLLKNQNKWETGIGIVKEEEHKIVLEKIRVLNSSNGEAKSVDFSEDNGNKFYVFANEYNFGTGFNNCLSIKDDTELSCLQATYLLDISEKKISVTLPEASNSTNLILEFKTNDGSYSAVLKTGNKEYTTLYANTYFKLISDGNKWIELMCIGNSSKSYKAKVFSAATNFSALNTGITPVSGALIFNNNGTIDNSNIFYSNNKLLLGSINESLANTIIPTSGNSPIVFNNKNNASDFIVKGSGDKNLFFGYDGKLGLNIPSSSRPQTTLHIINTSCQEGIRLENRNQCFPANITLYHRPNSIIQPNSPIGTINLSAKNSANTQVDYVQLVGKVHSYTANATKGEFSVKLENMGIKVEPLRVTTSGVFISNSLYINSLKYTVPTTSGNLLVSDANGNINLSSINNLSINLNAVKYSDVAPSGNVLISDGSGNLVVSNIANTPIVGLLDGEVVTFSGVC